MWSVEGSEKTMALRLRSAPSIKTRIVLSMVVVLALVAQPLYGVLSAKIVSALASHVVINEIKPSSVGGVERWVELYNPTDASIDMTNWRVVRGGNNFTNVFAAGVTIGAHQHYVVGSTSSSDSLPQIANGNVELWTGPASSGSQLDTVDYGLGVPVGQSHGRISDGADTFTTFTSPTKNAANIVPANPQLNAEEFIAVDRNYKGISVGFNVKDFDNVSDVTVKLTRADGTEVVKQGNQGVRDLISNQAVSTQLTTPFVIQEGGFTEASDTQYWQPAPATWSTATVPSSVTISVTDQNGTKSVTNSTFNQGAPNWPTYESLLPTIPPADTTAPTAPVINTPTNNQYFKNSPIQNKWSAVTDPSGIANYEIEYIYDDGHTFANGPTRLVPGTQTSRSHQPSTSEQGGVTIRVRAIDGAGNKSEYSAPVHYFYDAQDPTISLTEPQNGEIFGNNEELTVEAILGDNLGLDSYHLFMDGIEKPTTTATQTFSVGLTIKAIFNTEDLTNGEHTIVATVVDKAGRSTQASRMITIDKTAPTMTDYKLSDSYIGYLDTNPILTGLLTDTETNITDAKYAIWPLNNAGQRGTAIRGWTSVPAADGAYDSKSEATNSILDGLKDFPVGRYELGIRGYNGTDNRGAANLIFFVDNTAPSFTAQLSDNLFGPQSVEPRLTGTITDETSPIARMNYAIWVRNNDGSKGAVVRNWTDLSAADGAYDEETESLDADLNLKSLGQGAYILGVRGSDAAQNRASGGDFVFEVNSQEPHVAITSPSSNETVGGNELVIRGTATDDNFDRYQYYVKDENGQIVNNPGEKTSNSQVSDGALGAWDISGLPSGTYAVVVKVYDTADNATTTERMFTIDHSKPEHLTVLSPIANDTITDHTPTISGTTEPDAKVTVAVAGQTIITTASPTGGWSVTLAPVADGTYVVTITSEDAFGNAIQEQHTFTVGPLSISTLLGQPGLFAPFATPTPVAPQTPTAPDDSEVLGEQTTNPSVDQNVRAAIAATEAGWQLFGVMWYWWLLGASGLGAAAWWTTALARRRIAEDVL
jgi:lamin tail-like protein/Big-like domain-containing protein